MHQWDGDSYDRISGPQLAMGRGVLERLPLTGDETVLDAGCGSGRVTEELLAKLPRGRVVAVDQSDSMVAAARARLGDRVEVRRVDLLELELEQPVQAILSTATFHWIGDHDRLFARLRAALAPGGRLVAQCGGQGNIDALRSVAYAVLAEEPYAAHFADWRAPWNYAPPDLTRERLLRAGFAEADCWLTPSPQRPDHPREYLSGIVLGPHREHLPQELQAQFIDDVLLALGEPVVVDYVRLNIDAVA